MDQHDVHGEPAQEEFRMDYSEWSNNNIIAAVIFFGFLFCTAAIFMF